MKNSDRIIWHGKETEWESNASFWVKIIREKLDPYRVRLTNKAVLSCAPKGRKLSVLDAGCGEGYLCRELARRGHEAIGIDLSPRLIAAAQEMEAKNPLGIAYECRDFRKTDFPKDRFDVIIANHTINEINDPQKALSEFGRILRKSGVLAMLFLHPCFDFPGVCREENFAAEYFTKKKIVRDGFVVSGIKSPSGFSFLHMPLSEWAKAIFLAGFNIEKINEPHPALRDMAKDPFWKKNFGKPVFILIECRKK